MKTFKDFQALTVYRQRVEKKGFQSESSVPFEATIKGKKYWVEILSKRIGALEKFGTGLKAFALTLLSGGFALFSQEVRASWHSAFTGKKVIVVCRNTGIMNFGAFTLAQFKIGNKEEALNILESDPLMFAYVSKKNHNDREVLRTVCSNLGGRSLTADAARRMFDKKQLDDKDLMLLAVKSCPGMLRYVSRRLKGDKEIVRAAVELSPDTFEFAAPSLKRDHAFVLEMVASHGKTLLFADSSMGEDEEIVRTAIQNYGGALNAAAQQFRGNKEIVLLAMQQERIESSDQTPIFCTISRELQKDPDVYLPALQLKPAAEERDAIAHQKRTADKILENFFFHDMPEAAKDDRALFSILIRIDEDALQYASDALKEDLGS